LRRSHFHAIARARRLRPGLLLLVQSERLANRTGTPPFTRKPKPWAALAADCQKTVVECEYPRTATDRRYDLMADPRRVVERHVEAFNVRDADAEPWSDDADFVAPNASMHGREEVLGFLGVFWDAFPDGRLETSRLLAEGSVVAAEGRFIGTHSGVMRTPAGDVAATGRHVDFRWMSSYEVRGDELASEHLYFDQAELLGQLGLMPAT
jgi:predicted ester cyclase